MVDMDTIVSLCKRRGFVFPSSEIYGGLASTYDYGPLGVEMKRNIRESWWRTFIQGRDDCVGIESAILMHPQVWVTSGHLANFTDPLVECRNCHQRMRADHVEGEFAGTVKVDASKALVDLSNFSEDGTSYLTIRGLSIEAEDSSLRLEQALLISTALGNNSIYDALPASSVPGASEQRFILEPGGRLYPGPRDYALGFKLTPEKRVDLAAIVVLKLKRNTRFLKPVALSIRLSDRAISVSTPPPTCPKCGGIGSLGEPRQFNLMLKTFLGPVEDDAAVVYLRPETAQGIFVNFLNVLTATRRKLPFGIGQIGKSFRNEITTGNFIFRTREFEQMELEFFVKPGTDDEWHARWIQAFVDWFHGMGIAPDKLRVRAHEKEELSHYSKATSDIEYLFPWGWGELMGIANRTDFDLKAHSQAAGVKLEYFDDETHEHVVPYVIEPACGVDRILITNLINAYDEEDVPAGDGKTEKRVVLHLHPSIAPVKVAVLPLSRNARLTPKAREVYDLVRKHFATQYDDAQSIGRRYRRQDEIGTPLCVTVDFQTVEQDNAVTIRERDSMAQVRVPIPELAPALRKKLGL